MTKIMQKLLTNINKFCTSLTQFSLKKESFKKMKNSKNIVNR
jgi:hypothetical protein